MYHRKRSLTLFPTLALVVALVPGQGASGQAMPGGPIPGVKTGGSTNVKVLSHIPLGANFATGDIDIEQELARPYVYAARRMTPSGFDVISVKDPSKAKIIYSWRIENADLHQGAGSLNPMLIKSKGRYYLTNGYPVRPAGPRRRPRRHRPRRHRPALIPPKSRSWDGSGCRSSPGGFHEIVCLQAFQRRGPANRHHERAVRLHLRHGQILAGDASQGLVGKIPVPDTLPGMQFLGYHDIYVGYDPATHQDKFYGAGLDGFYVFDITNLAGTQTAHVDYRCGRNVNCGHTFTPESHGSLCGDERSTSTRRSGSLT